MNWDDDNEPWPADGDEGADAWPTDALDRAIAEAARDYNAPTGAAPRDAMWAAIVGARIPATPDAAPAVVQAPAIVPLRIERTAVRVDRRRTWMGLAAAAAIFLATGVGLGRWWGASGNVAARPGAAPQVAAAERSGAPTVTPTPTVGMPDASTETTVPASTSGRDDRGERRVAQAVPRADRSQGAAHAVTGVDPYDVAIARHFTQAEALLVSYGRDSVNVALDGRLAQWARPLLSNTQLLLDSPAADDPRRRRLLEDLELVLAQVARLAPTTTGDSAAAGTDSTTRRAVRADRVERQIIDGTLQRAQLLPRIRNLVASGS